MNAISTVLPQGTILIGRPGSVPGGTRPAIGTVRYAMRSIVGNKAAMAPFRRDWVWLVPNGGDVSLLSDSQIVEAIIRQVEAGSLHAYYQPKHADGPVEPLVNFLAGIFNDGFIAEAEKAGIQNTEWGAALLQILRDVSLIPEFQAGLREGAWQGIKNFISGIAMMIGKTVQLGLDSGVLGYAGDYARGWTGKLPNWLDEIVPSKQRAGQTVAQVSKIIDSITGYIADRSGNLWAVVEDIKGVFESIWGSLKADHAKAAARGPKAEARWWGYIVGLVLFEVALTFVPVAGMAGKANKVAKGADKVSDAARAGDKASDAKRAGSAAGKGRVPPKRLPHHRPDLDEKWYDPNTGDLKWPPDSGFEPGTKTPGTLTKGTVIDRYGGPNGNFTSPNGASFDSRALPYDPNKMPYHQYEVLRDIPVDQGKAAAWFDQPGGATQYVTKGTIQDLLDANPPYLRRVGP